MKRAVTITLIIACGFATTALMGLPGSEGIASAASIEALPPPAHGHNHEGMTWPPQPRGITNVVVHSSVEQEKIGRAIERARMDRLESKAKTHPEANRALGNRFTRITVIDREDKTTGKKATQLVFFSRDNNATVEVQFENGEIQAVKSVPASQYQPEITDEEIAEAAQLARTHFLNQGLARIADLKAYGILAYKPKGGGFFDTRVLYVSFQQHDDALPEFEALVDLTNQLILKTRQEQ